MQLSVEISKYPLADDYITPIKGFIEQLNQYPDIQVITNTMSTQLFGDYDSVMQALQATAQAANRLNMDSCEAAKGVVNCRDAGGHAVARPPRRRGEA